MKKLVLVFSILGLMCGCGGGGKSTPPAISVSLAPATQTTIDQGQTLNFTATVANDSSSQGVTWSVSGTGCSGSACGTFTNTAALTATYNAPTPVSSNLTVSVLATSAADSSKSASSSVVVTAPPSITTTSLANGTVGTAYSKTLQATGGAGTLTWSLATGSSLPAGLSLSGSGAIFGTPTASGPSTFTVKVTDSSGAQAGPLSATQPLSLTINPAVSVSITSPTVPQTLAVSQPLAITASLTGTSNMAVTWAVNGVTGGNATYGTISGSGLSVTYTAPASVPSPATFNITVTSQADTTKSASLSVTITAAAACTSSGNESILSGQYAFSLSGFNATGFLAAVGSFTADGTGKITAGEVDSNGALGVQQADITTSASSYSVGSDDRGCATIVTPFYTFTTRFALGTFSSGKATEGRMIEWEAPSSSAYIATGHILQQTASSFSAGPSGNYAFSLVGVERTSGRFGAVGVLTANGGSFSNVEEDVNAAGGTDHITGITGTYGSVNANGRFTGTIVTQTATSPLAFYMVSRSEMLFVITEDNPIGAGELRKQTGTFSNSSVMFGNSSVNGNMVLYATGVSGGPGGRAIFGLVNANGSGSLTATVYVDDAGTLNTTPDTAACTYSVASNGRMTLGGSSCASDPPVFYLTAANTAFMHGTDDNLEIGQVEPQATGPFTTASLSGTFYTGTLEAVNHGAETGVEVATLNGRGGVSGTFDFTATTNQTPDQAFTDTVTVNSDGTFSVGSGGTTIMGIVISGTKFVIADSPSSTYPSISVIKQ